MTLELAERLIALRKEHHLSQEQLAEKLGLSRQAISKWERAEAAPDTDNLIALAALYEMSLDDLIQTGRTREKKKESVHIGFNGIHVENERESVHIGLSGIHVEDAENSVHLGKEQLRHLHQKSAQQHRAERLIGGITALLIALAYFLMGGIWNLWHPGWLVFLLIPIISSLIDAIRAKNPHHFAWPVFVTLIFLYIGLLKGCWHPTWAIFITIPFYYMVVDLIWPSAKKNKTSQADQKQPDGSPVSTNEDVQL